MVTEIGAASLSARKHIVAYPDETARLTRSERATFVFHTFSNFGHGHVARCHKIAREYVARENGDAIVISSHPEFLTGDDAGGIGEVGLPSFLLPPSVWPTELPSAGLLSPIPEVAAGDLPRYKGHLLAEIVRRVRPVGILIDNFPFSPKRAADECEEALGWLRAHAPEALRCAGSRGVLSRGYSAEEQALIRRLLDVYIDVFFVYVDPREGREILEAYPFLRPFEAKMHFVGYVAPAPAGSPPAARPGSTLAMFGGGIDGYAKVRVVCDAFRLLARTHPERSLDVVTGHRLPESAYQELVAGYDGVEGICIRRFCPALGRRLVDYELVVSMGGYNALTELYRASVRSIVLPRVSPTNDEQRTQALKFLRYGAVDRVIDPAALSVGALARAMAEVLASEPAVRLPVHVDGARATVAVLRAALAGRSAASSRHG